MEDQQPAAGDLTAEENPAAAEHEAADTASGDAAQRHDESGDATTESAGATGDVGEQENSDLDDADRATGTQPDTGKRKKLSAGKAWAIVAMAAAVLFVGSAGFAGAMVQPYLADRASAATKLNVARTAARAITTLWSYTPENMDTLADRASAYLGGDFAAQYRKYVDTIAPMNKHGKVTSSTEVTGAAVESLEGSNAVVIVYTNTTSKSPLTKDIPSTKYLSYRITMKRSKDRWLVTRMTTITTLDFTPKI